MCQSEAHAGVHPYERLVDTYKSLFELYCFVASSGPRRLPRNEMNGRPYVFSSDPASPLSFAPEMRKVGDVLSL